MTYDPYRMRTGLPITEPDPAPRFSTPAQASVAQLMRSARSGAQAAATANPDNLQGVIGGAPTVRPPGPDRFNTGAYGTPAVGPRGGALPLNDYLPDDPFRMSGQIDMGKFFTPPGRQPVGTPPQLAEAGPGLAGTLLSIPGALLGMFNGDLGQHVTNLGRLVGGALDLPFSGIRPIESLPGGQDPTKAFAALPMSPDKQAYMQAIHDDPLHREQFMLQYVRQHAEDLASLQGIARPAGQFNAPTGNISQQLSQLVFGALSLPQMAIARTITGARPFDDLMRSGADIPEELVALQNRLKRGEITRDQFLDDVSTSAFRYTNDTSLYGTLLSLGIDIISDPLTWATLGTGAAIKVGESAGLEAVRLVRATAIKAGRESLVTGTEREVFERMAREAATRGEVTPGGAILRNEMDNAVMQRMKTEHPDLYRQALDQMDPRTRAGLKLQPYTKPAHAIVNRIQDPFSWFGADRAAKVFQSRLAAAVPTGFTQAYGATRIAGLADYFEAAGAGDNFQRAFGVAAANSSLLLQTRSLINDVVRSGRELTGSPKQWLEQRMKGAERTHAKTMVTETEELVRRQMKDFTPSGVTGKEAVAAHLTTVRETAAKQLAEMTDHDVARAAGAVAKMDETSLAAIHHLYYGHAIDGMISARESAIKAALKALDEATAKGNPKAIAKAQEHLANVKRYTLISERALDSRSARELKRLLNGADAEAAAREAVRRYDIIAANFDGKALAGPELVQQMQRFLDMALSDDGKRLAKRVEADKLEPDVQRWLAGQRDVVGDGAYHIALSPEDQWGLASHPDGTLQGASIWLDATNEHATPWRPMTRLDVLRMRMSAPIRGSRLLVEARRSFTRDGVERGLTKGQADNLFQSLRNEANRLGTGPRGMSKDAIWGVAQKVEMPAEVRTRLGERGVAEMLVRAYEGELSTVGVTSKVSGRAKTTFAGRGNNYVAQVAEALYPKLRFSFSPLFWAQEWVEGPFFNLLRGIKPGIRWSDEDRAWQELLRNMTDSAESFTDQQEYVLLSMATSSEVKRVAGPETARGQALRDWGSAAKDLRSVKELNKSRMAARESADHFYEAINDINPSLWNRMVDEYGTTDRRKIMLQHFADRGALSDDARAVVHRMDGYKPASFGRRDKVNLSDVAADFGHQSGASLHRSVRDGITSETTFRSTMKEAGADPDYIERAWSVANGYTLDEWAGGLESELRAAGRTAVEAKAFSNSFRSLARARATAHGLSPDEWLNRNLNAMPVGLSASSSLPTDAFLQTMREYIDQNGMEYVARDGADPARFHAIQLHQQRLAERASVAAGEKHGKDVINAQKRVAAGKYKPPAYANVDPTKTFSLDLGGTKVSFGDLPTEHWEGWVGDTVTPEQLTEFSQWYDHMTTLWTGLASKLPESTVERLRQHYIAKGHDVAASGLAFRDELAARLLTAFSVTQQNTSVRDGFTFVMRMMGALDGSIEVKTRQKVAGLGVIQKRLDDLLIDIADVPPGEFGQKLIDFADASSGKTVRTLTAHLPGAKDLQPAAIDIWMKRAFGYMDTAYEDYLAQQMVRTGQFAKVGEAKAHLAATLGYDPKTLKKPGAPTTFEYEAILQKVNDIKDRWNDRTVFPDGFGGEPGHPKTWTATDVQATIWMAQQQAVGYPETSPGALFVTGGYTVPTEVSTPADGSMFARDFPKMSDYHPDVQEAITRRIEEFVEPLVAELSEATSVTRLPSIGGWHDSVARNWVSVIVGDEAQAEANMLIRAYLTQQEAIFATGAPHPMEVKNAANLRSDPHMRRYWGLDFEMAPGASAADMPALIDHMHRIMPSYKKDPGWSGSMSAQTDEGLFVGRAMYMQAPIARFKSADGKKWAGTTRELNKMDEKTFQSKYSFTPEQEAALTDGSWVFATDDAGARLYPDITAPIPVVVNRRLQRVIQHANPNYAQQGEELARKVAAGADHEEAWAQTYGQTYLDALIQLGHEDVVRKLTGGGRDESGQVVRGYAHAVRDAIRDAHGHEGNADGTFAQHRRALDLSDGRSDDRLGTYGRGDGPYATDIDHGAAGATAADRLAAGGADGLGGRLVRYQRGPGRGRARIRGAMTFDGEQRGTMHIGATADASTIVHETFHIFARDLDPSATRGLLDAYQQANGLTRKQNVVTRKAEEWMAAEFERYLASGTAPTPMLQGIFNAYGQWANDVGLPKANPALTSVFDRFFTVPESEKHVFNADEQRIWGAGRTAIKAGEEQAHTTHYYRRGRTWAERSINHPYLGLYPASYMWGKVLPELGRFLIQKPFGLDAPLGGLVAANHVYNSIQLSAQSDTDLRDFLASNPDMTRMLNMLTPGIPWNIPVNMPLWARRAAEVQAENERRKGTSSAPRTFDPFQTIRESIENAFTIGRDVGQFGDVLSEATQGTSTPAEQAEALRSRAQPVGVPSNAPPGSIRVGPPPTPAAP